MTNETKPRFMTPTQAADELNVKPSQIHSRIKAGELRALQVGGRGMWRTGRQDLEDYIEQAYRCTAERIAAGELEDDGESGDSK